MKLIWPIRLWQHTPPRPMMTSSNGNISASLALCAGNSPVTGEFPAQWPVMRSFDVFFDRRLNKWLSKQSWGWWSETPLCSLWRHCNHSQQRVVTIYDTPPKLILNKNLASANCQIVLIFWKFQNDWATELDVVDERDTTRLVFRMTLGRGRYSMS